MSVAQTQLEIFIQEVPLKKEVPIISAPRIGSAVVVKKGDKLLLGKRAKEPEKGKWILPGGKIKVFESIKEAARRELLEETGLDVEIGSQIGTYEVINIPNEHRIIIYSWGSVKSGTLKPSSDVSDLRFYSKEEVKNLELTEIIKKVLEDIGWL